MTHKIIEYHAIRQTITTIVKYYGMLCSSDDFAEVFDLGYYILNKI